MKSFRNIKILTNITANADKGEIIDTTNFQNVILCIVGSNSVNASIKIKGSVSDVPPNFIAQGINDQFTYIGFKDYTTGNIIDGNVGVVLNGDGVRLIELNTNGISFITLEANIITGKVNATASLYGGDN